MKFLGVEFEIDSINIFHDNVGIVLMDTRINKGDDPLMLEFTKNIDLFLESSKNWRVRRVEFFDGNSFSCRSTTKIDRRHGSFTNETFHPVRSDLILVFEKTHFFSYSWTNEALYAGGMCFFCVTNAMVSWVFDWASAGSSVTRR